MTTDCIDWDAFYTWALSAAELRPPLKKPEGAEVWEAE